MNKMKKWLILFCAFLVFVSACKDDSIKINELAAECDAGNKEACKKLADIAKNDEDWGVQMTAVEKLTNQKLLADIARSDIDTDFAVREAAVERLTDQSVLAMIALENVYGSSSALVKLSDQASLAKVAADDKDWRVRLIFKYITAFDPVPIEDRHRLMIEVLPAICVLSYPGVVSAVGDIVLIKTEWKGISLYYSSDDSPFQSGYKPGEIFTCSIKVQKLPEPLSHTWSTDFPSKTSSLSFCDAHVRAEDLLIKIFEKLTDQRLLADIARNDKDSDVRNAAEERLKELPGK